MGTSYSEDPNIPAGPVYWSHDSGLCEYPGLSHPVALEDVHADHIVPLTKGGTNTLANLRSLCRYHFVLRSCHVKEVLIEAAIRDGIIPESWEMLVWDREREDPQAG